MIDLCVRDVATLSSTTVVSDHCFVDTVPSSNLPRQFGTEVQRFREFSMSPSSENGNIIPCEDLRNVEILLRTDTPDVRYDFITFSVHKIIKSYMLFSYLVVGLSVLMFAQQDFVLFSTRATIIS
jgi:hypothetical protein